LFDRYALRRGSKREEEEEEEEEERVVRRTNRVRAVVERYSPPKDFRSGAVKKAVEAEVNVP
jgi:protein subunit release factor B